MPLTEWLNSNTRSEIKAFFESDRAILLTCIAISLFFWLLVKLSQEYRTDFTFEIDYNIPGSSIFLDIPATEIKAYGEGTGWSLMGNKIGGKRKIELKAVETGEVFRSSDWLKARIIEISSGNLNWFEIYPDFLRFDLVRKKVKKVPVSLRGNFNFSPGFHFSSPPLLQPDSVTITGPSPLIDTIQIWSTDTISKKGIKNSFTVNIPLKQPATSLITLSPENILFNAEVEQLTEKILFLPVTIKNAPDSVRIFPKKIKISVVLGLKYYNEVEASDFSAEVDMREANLHSSNNTLPIKLSKKPDLVKSVHFFTKSAEFYVVRNEKSDASQPIDSSALHF